MVFKQAMASLNLLVRLSLVWVQLTFWHIDLRYDRRTPSVWNDGHFSPLTVNKDVVWKKPLHNLLRHNGNVFFQGEHNVAKIGISVHWNLKEK